MKDNLLRLFILELIDIKILLKALIVLPLFLLQFSISSYAYELNSKIYTIEGVDIDKTSVSAAVARDNALIEAQRLAFNKLLKRLVITSEYNKLPKLDDKQISQFISNIQVNSEKTSSTRYIANLVYRFKAREVREFLKNNNIVFSETYSKSRLILPVFDNAGTLMLWDKNNPWFASWKKILLLSNLDTVFPILIPDGSLSDISMLGPIQAIEGDEKLLLDFAKKYNVNNIIVAHAVLVQDLNANIPRLHVTIRQIGSLTNDLYIKSYSGSDREKVFELLDFSASDARIRMEDSWKKSNRIFFDNKNKVSINVLLPDIKSWLEIEKIIKSIPLVDYIEIIHFTRKDIQIMLHFFGNIDQLKFAFNQSKVNLIKENDFWVINKKNN
ncbi:DUF2066 domain-containing protein [Alphaproteobacteria bacterium]|nr:DUF2066 domain-containing protein [Alphaproteobacteria bacterium]